jgi:hypothetical protein
MHEAALEGYDKLVETEDRPIKTKLLDSLQHRSCRPVIPKSRNHAQATYSALSTLRGRLADVLGVIHSETGCDACFYTPLPSTTHSSRGYKSPGRASLRG